MRCCVLHDICNQQQHLQMTAAAGGHNCLCTKEAPSCVRMNGRTRTVVAEISKHDGRERMATRFSSTKRNSDRPKRGAGRSAGRESRN